MLTPRKDVLENSSQLLHSPSDDVGTDGILLADERERAAGEVLFCLYPLCYATYTDSAILTEKRLGKFNPKYTHLKRHFLVALNQPKPCKLHTRVLKEFDKTTHYLGQ